MKDLRGHVAVITGAVGDLGRALSQHLAQKEGMRIWACDINEAGLRDFATELGKYTAHVYTKRVDVTDEGQLANFAQDVLAKEKRLDVWFNNAGIPPNISSFEDLNREYFDRVMDVNFGGVARGTRVALGVMQEQARGTIVNIASVAGLIPAPFGSAYCAAKHAVVGLTRSLQMELELLDSPVHTLLVSSGFFASQMIDSAEHNKFPDWLRWTLSDPESVAKEIVAALKKERKEVVCALNGKLMQALYKVWPGTTKQTAKLLQARSLKDVFLNRFQL